jgi:hypothetical protein
MHLIIFLLPIVVEFPDIITKTNGHLIIGFIFIFSYFLIKFSTKVGKAKI